MDKEPTKHQLDKTIPTEIQVDESLSLKQLSSDDLEDYYELVDQNREHLARHGDFTETRIATRQTIALELGEKTGNTRFGIYDEGRLVGRLDLIPYQDGNIGVGYWLSEHSQGRGLMTRSLRAAIDYARGQMDATTIWAGVTKSNVASATRLEQLGFQKVEDVDTYDRYRLDV